MYCHICGKELESHVLSCPDCGASVPTARENRSQAISTVKSAEVVLQESNEGKDHHDHPAPSKGIICPGCGNENLQIMQHFV